MNWAQFKKRGLGLHVELEPRAVFLDEHSRVLVHADHDWVVQSFPEDEVVVIEHAKDNHRIVRLAKDHIYDFRSNPQRSSDERTYGFLVLKVQLFVQGDRIWVRPNRAPGQAVALGDPVDVDALVQELGRLRVAVMPRRLGPWQFKAIAEGLRGQSFEVWIGTVGHDAEAIGLWNDITKAVKDAGLKVVAHTSWELAQGVSLSAGGTPADRQALKAAFATAGIELWEANGEGARLPRLEIIVGTKPPPA